MYSGQYTIKGKEGHRLIPNRRTIGECKRYVLSTCKAFGHELDEVVIIKTVRGKFDRIENYYYVDDRGTEPRLVVNRDIPVTFHNALYGGRVG